jgi:hypothetical protein
MRKTLFLALAALMLLAGCKKESSEKKILSFKFAAPAVEATIDESAKTIVAVVPFGTSVTGLVPMITISDKATVVPASGTVVDFTNPVDFTVTAEDGSSVVYKATVTVDPNGGGGGGGGGTGDPTQWSGNIDGNVIWEDLGLPIDYIIDGWVEINTNASLTINPGVTIMFTGVNGGIGVGENAGLKMVGTSDKPIVLEGPAGNPNNGSWDCIRINSKRNDNQLEYVQFLRGGADDGPWGSVVHLVNGRVSMKNCVVDGGLSHGVDLEYEDSYFTAFENNTIKNCAVYPVISEYFTGACKNIGDGNAFINNGRNMFCCFHGVDEMQENLTMHALSIPYYFNNGNSFNGSKTMTIEAGVEIVMPMLSSISVGDQCNFKAEGTADHPIIIRCENAAEAWGGIQFWSTRNGNVMNYCQIKNCGLNDGWSERSCLYIGQYAKLNLSNNVFGPSNFNGVAIENLDYWYGNVSHSGNTFIGCTGGNVWIESFDEVWDELP